MIYKSCDEWCSRILIINDERREVLRICWEVASKSEKEKIRNVVTNILSGLETESRDCLKNKLNNLLEILK